MSAAQPYRTTAHWLISSGALAIQSLKDLIPGPEYAAVLSPLALAASAVMSYSLNRLTAAHDRQDQLAAAARDLLTNHDITLSQARAIAARLRSYAGQLPDGPINQRLRELAAAAETWWPPIVNDTARSELAHLRDDRVVELLTTALTTQDPFEIPLPAWQRIIIEADATVPGDHPLGQDLAAYFASHHHATFRADFIEALKTDLQTDGGKALSAVLLRYLATLVSELRAIAASQDEMKSTLSSISKTLLHLQKAVTAQLAQPGLTETTRAHLDGIEHRITLELDAILHSLDQLHTDNQTLRSEILESRRQQAENHATLLAAMQALPSAIAAAQQANPQADKAATLASAYATLDASHQLPPGTLERELPAFAKKLLATPDTPLMDQANAEFVLKNYASAEEIALAAAAQPIQDAIAALVLASQAATAQIQYQRALDHLRTAAALTSEERDTLAWAEIQNEISRLLYLDGQYNAQATLTHHVWQTCEKAGHPEHPTTLRAHHLWATALRAQGKNSEAEAEHRAVLALRQRILGLEHPHTLDTRNNLALALSAQGKSAEAEAEHRSRLSIEERVLGPEHPDTLNSRNNLALTLDAQGKHAEAEAEHRAVLALQERVLGLDHPDTLKSRNNLAITLDDQGKYAEAEAEHRAVLAIRERIFGSAHPTTLKSRNNLATALHSQGKHAEAEAEYRAVHALHEQVLGLDHPHVFLSCYNLSLTLENLGQKDEALDYARRALEGWTKVLGADHPDSLDAKQLVADLEQE